MPRPGPRPYECVRRAWHSERHQPMRGSIIQQIFRVVHESHSSVTRKNREWQEKLPIVVFKAEEIMYSKANSEAEYMNLETLWDRVNDAVNTIIRRDESSETGDLLPPCIEAALNLGCHMVRASRSQRNNNPRTYLTPRLQEPKLASNTRTSHNPSTEGSHQVPSNYPNDQTNNAATPSLNCPFHYDNASVTPDYHQQLSSGSIYPLYYGSLHQVGESQLVSQVPENTNPSTVFVGRTSSKSLADSAKVGVLQNFFPFSSPVVGSNETTQANIGNVNDKLLGTATECDLSLRLGLPEPEDMVSSGSHEGGNIIHLSSQRQQYREFCF